MIRYTGLLAIALTSACFHDFSNPPARIDTQCLNAERGTACDDHNPCTRNDACDGAGACRGAAIDGTCERLCSGDGDCNDDNACTNEVCVSGLCTYSFNTSDCGTCGLCDGAGACVYDPTQNADCGDAGCGFCTGLGTCGRADSGTACATCMTCNDSGLCDRPIAQGLPGLNCDGTLTACSAADVCDGAGGLVVGDYDTTTACATCMFCDGHGV